MKNYESIKRLVNVFAIHEEASNTVGALKDILCSEMLTRTDIDLKAVIEQANEHNVLYKRVAKEVLDDTTSSSDLIEIASILHEDTIRIATTLEFLVELNKNHTETIEEFIAVMCLTEVEEHKEICSDIVSNYIREDRIKAINAHNLIMIGNFNSAKKILKSLKTSSELPCNVRQLRKLKHFYTKNKTVLEIWEFIISMCKANATDIELQGLMQIYRDKNE